MNQTRVIRIREDILKRNVVRADQLRDRLTAAAVTLINVMSSPGAGKTSLILRTIEEMRGKHRIAVVEADLDSTVDADKMTAVGIPAVQIETGGFCHVEASMMEAALRQFDLETLDVVFLENVGNLICTAQSDTGAHVNVAILSVPEGDDKPLKYPIMFRAAQAVVLNKVDYLSGATAGPAEFDIEAFKQRVRVLNPEAPVFEVSCRTGRGMSPWVAWLEAAVPG